jgi:hypothetical protein
MGVSVDFEKHMRQRLGNTFETHKKVKLMSNNSLEIKLLKQCSNILNILDKNINETDFQIFENNLGNICLPLLIEVSSPHVQKYLLNYSSLHHHSPKTQKSNSGKELGRDIPLQTRQVGFGISAAMPLC